MEGLTADDPTTIGPYKLVARLGSGGMGNVYLGASRAADKVAVKIIRPGLVRDPELRDRFDTEVAALRRVYGPRVARFEGAGFDHDEPWLAVEYVRGRSLKQAVEINGPLEAEPAAALGAMLAEGLAKIHAEGLLHRDLKPQNVLLGPTGPKVIDFGLARLVSVDQELTVPGAVLGTVAYMPPEQAAGSEVGPAADVYSLAATLVYAATGRLLYGGLTGQLLRERLCDPTYVPDLSGLPATLTELLAEMLAHDPAARPALALVDERLYETATNGARTILELRDQLAQIGHDEAPEPPIPPELAVPQIESEDLGTEEQPSESEQPAPEVRRNTVDVNIDDIVTGLRARYDRQSTL